jgi:mannose-6-phosphate isomerase-like protein (cupin superfamily)
VAGSKPNQDGFEQTLINSIINAIGKVFTQFIQIQFEPIDDKLVCAVNVKPSKKIAFVKHYKDKKQILYVRSGCTTQQLEGQEICDFVQIRQSSVISYQ